MLLIYSFRIATTATTVTLESCHFNPFTHLRIRSANYTSRNYALHKKPHLISDKIYE